MTKVMLGLVVATMLAAPAFASIKTGSRSDSIKTGSKFSVVATMLEYLHLA